MKPHELSDLADPNVAAGVLASLRWKPDQQIINPFGEHVWLKQMPGYITDCCFASEPCDRHAGPTDKEKQDD